MDVRVDGEVYECYLGDDGTLDTVIIVNNQEYRFGDTSHCRDNDGAMTDEGFRELCCECIEDL